MAQLPELTEVEWLEVKKSIQDVLTKYFRKIKDLTDDQINYLTCGLPNQLLVAQFRLAIRQYKQNATVEQEIDWEEVGISIRSTTTQWLSNNTIWDDEQINSVAIVFANLMLNPNSPYGSPFISAVRQFAQLWAANSCVLAINDRENYTPEEFNDLDLSVQKWHKESSNSYPILTIPPRILWDPQYRQNSILSGRPIKLPVNPFTAFLAKRKIAQASEIATDTPSASTSTVTNGIESNSDQNEDIPEEGRTYCPKCGLDMDCTSNSKRSFDAIDKYLNKIGMDDTKNIDLITDQYIAEHLQEDSTGKQAQSGQLPSTSETAGPSKRHRTTSENTTTTLTSSSLTEPCPGRSHRDSCATEISVDHVQYPSTSTLKSPDSTSSSMPKLKMILNTSGKKGNEPEPEPELGLEPKDANNRFVQLNILIDDLVNIRNNKKFIKRIQDMRQIVAEAESLHMHRQQANCLNKDFKVTDMKQILTKIQKKVLRALKEGIISLKEVK